VTLEIPDSMASELMRIDAAMDNPALAAVEPENRR
jgi:hypothetical protein